MPTARNCAEVLLETLPNLMRSIGGAMRQKRWSDEEALTMSQVRVLEMLHHKSWTLSELASRHHVTPSTMSRSIDVLVRRAWVDRRYDPDNRRQVILSLTEEGQSARAAMVKQAQEMVAQLLEQLDEDERAKLYDGLRVLQGLLARTHQCAPPGTDEGASDQPR